MNRLVIPRALVTAMFDRARAGAPDEIVGMLTGIGEYVREDVRLTNIAGPRSFAVHPREQFLAECTTAARGQQIQAIYHSHPDGSAVLSAQDITYARRWPIVHVVLAVAHTPRGTDKMCGYRVSEIVRKIPLTVA